MSDVIDLDVCTTVPLPPDKVLDRAAGAYRSLLIVGWGVDGDGVLDIRIGGDLSNAEAVYILECAKLELMGRPRLGGDG